MIEAYEPSDTRARLADWVELRALVADGAAISDAEVLRSVSVLEEPDHHAVTDLDDTGDDLFDEEILESRVEEQRAALWNELAFRQDVLGEAYPFRLVATETGGWRLSLRSGTDEATRGATVAYYAALVMAAFRQGYVGKQQAVSDEFDGLARRIPELFQSLSVLAASQVLDEVYWFGWPRKDASGFLAALKDLRDLIGLGLLREPPSTTTVNMKDGTIDLIAWRRFQDQMYGAMVLYGQVASGYNWTSKPLKTHINGKFLDHFNDEPSAQYLVSIFIPFVAHDDLNPRKGEMYEVAARDAARSREKDFGLVIDRLRIVELLAQNRLSGSKLHNSPDPQKIIDDLNEWIANCKAYVVQGA